MYSIGIEISKKEIRAGLVKLADKPELAAVTFAASGDNKLEIIGELCHSLVKDAGLTPEDVDYVGVAGCEKLVGTVCPGCGVDFAEITKYFPAKRCTLPSVPPQRPSPRKR